ncbi:MAG: acyl-CoA/acyl-ACP dehydrogenase [Deltaproteobacteria bacterium]|nr:acyl-CoA/acyl-ACP dehydrogenase [Deltaproteobacteria bacterium]
MNLDLDETQSLLRETVRGFLEDEVRFDRIRELEAEQGWDAGLWKSLCEQGWLGIAFDSALAGEGGSAVDLGLLVEDFARRAVMVPILEVAVAGRALQGSGALAEELLPGILAGDVVPVPAILEQTDRFDVIDAELEEDGTLTGEKIFVDYGQHATHHVVAARRAGETGLYLLDTSGQGVRTEPLLSIGRTPVCVAHYDAVPTRFVAGADGLADMIRLGRVLAAIQCVGSMQQSLDATVAYAGVREQFGKPIGSFQAVKHHLANMLIRVSSARLLCYDALSALDSGMADDVRIAAAKASASRAAPEVLMLGHQIHGGNGVIEENDLYFFTLRGKERSLAWGSVEECLDIMATGVGEGLDFL